MTLAARDITKRFGGLTALSQVSLELKPGEVHGLIGPNGSGKTTLLNLLSGYYRPDEGKIAIDETEISGATCSDAPASALRVPSRSRGCCRPFPCSTTPCSAAGAMPEPVFWQPHFFCRR